MFLLVTKRVAPQLQEVAILEDSGLDGLTGPIHRSDSSKLYPGARNLDRGVFWQNIRVLEQINVTLLTATNRSQRLIKDELLSGKGSCHDIEPAIFESAFYQAHAYTGGYPNQGKSDGAAGSSTFCKNCDRIKQHSAETSANQAADHAVITFFGRLSDDSVNQTAGCAKDHPRDASRDPHRRIMEAVCTGCVANA